MNFCVTISEKNIEYALLQIEKFDFAEIRIDIIGERNPYLTKIFSLPKTLIATYRPNGFSVEHRINFQKKMIDIGAKMVDLEIDTPPKLIEDMTEYAKSKGAKVILSYHNMTSTDDYETLSNMVKLGKSYGADYVKIATKINNHADLKKIFRLYAEHNDIIAIGMGKLGKITRLASLYFDVPFTYVYHGTIKHRLAEGQFKFKTVANILKLMED